MRIIVSFYLLEIEKGGNEKELKEKSQLSAPSGMIIMRLFMSACVRALVCWCARFVHTHIAIM